MSDARGGGLQALEEITVMRDALVGQVSASLELPAPDVVLDLGSRRGDDRRMAAHLHQMCALHRANYAQATKIKHLYLVEAFLQLVASENPVALHAMARSMFELSALTHEVQSRLADTTRNCTPTTWKPMGEKFFGIVVRARFGTTNPEHRTLLINQGISSKRLEPFNVTHCIEGLAAEAGQTDALERYDILCDFVHHNLGSSSMANSGSGVADAARSAGGGMIRSHGPMTIVRYEYPVRGQSSRVLDAVAPGFLRDATACINWMNATPESPFSSGLLSLLLGNPIGVDVLRWPGEAK